MPVKKLAPKSLARRAGTLALQKKAEEVMILDLRELSAACDYFVICSGNSEQHVMAIASHIEETLRQRSQPPWHVEGRGGRRWILLDFVDIVVHVFHSESRDYYTLERLWADAPVTRMRETKKRRAEA